MMDYKLTKPEEISLKLNSNQEDINMKESIISEYLKINPEIRDYLIVRGLLR